MMETDKKTIFITEKQVKSIYNTILRESLVVNSELVLDVKKFLDKHYRAVRYDDVDENGDLIEPQPYAIQSLTSKGEPMQTFSIERFVSKLASHKKFRDKIKDDTDREKFFKQLVDDWIHGNISHYGDLTVNVIK